MHTMHECHACMHIMHTVRVLCDAILSEHVSVRNTNLYTNNGARTARHGVADVDQAAHRGGHQANWTRTPLVLAIPHASRYANRLRAHMGCRPKATSLLPPPGHGARTSRTIEDYRGDQRLPLWAVDEGSEGGGRHRPSSRRVVWLPTSKQ